MFRDLYIIFVFMVKPFNILTVNSCIKKVEIFYDSISHKVFKKIKITTILKIFLTMWASELLSKGYFASANCTLPVPALTS